MTHIWPQACDVLTPPWCCTSPLHDFPVSILNIFDTVDDDAESAESDAENPFSLDDIAWLTFSVDPDNDDPPFVLEEKTFFFGGFLIDDTEWNYKEENI